MNDKPNLSQLCDRYYDLQETVTDLPTDLPPELEAALKELESDRDLAQAQFQDKIDNYLDLIKSRQQWIAIRQERIQELNRLVEIDRNLVKKLGDRLQTVLSERGVKQLRTRNFNLTIANNGGKLPLKISDRLRDEDLSQLPRELIITENKLNKEAVREKLAAGEDLWFAKLGDRGRHLRIK